MSHAGTLLLQLLSLNGYSTMAETLVLAGGFFARLGRSPYLPDAVAPGLRLMYASHELFSICYSLRCQFSTLVLTSGVVFFAHQVGDHK